MPVLWYSRPNQPHQPELPQHQGVAHLTITGHDCCSLLSLQLLPQVLLLLPATLSLLMMNNTALTHPYQQHTSSQPKNIAGGLSSDVLFFSSNSTTRAIAYNLLSFHALVGLPKPQSYSRPLLPPQAFDSIEHSPSQAFDSIKHKQHQALTAAVSNSCSSCCRPKRSSPASPMQSYTASATEKSSFCV